MKTKIMTSQKQLTPAFQFLSSFFGFLGSTLDRGIINIMALALPRAFRFNLFLQKRIYTSISNAKN